MHKDFFKGKIEEFGEEEGRKKFEKLDKLAEIAEKGLFLLFSGFYCHSLHSP